MPKIGKYSSGNKNGPPSSDTGQGGGMSGYDRRSAVPFVKRPRNKIRALEGGAAPATVYKKGPKNAKS